MVACCLLSVGVLLFGEATGREAVRRVAKPAASLFFVLVALQSGVTSWILAGLVAGAVGDVLLLGRSHRWLAVGIGAFLLNHLAYGVAFVEAGVNARSGLVAGLPLCALGAFVVWRLRGRVGRLLPLVVLYIAVITGMVAAAAGTGRMGWMVGATLFFVSDLAVARQRFVERSLANKLVGLPLYYAAQLLFASGV